jgi:hypothetical protein
MRANTPTEDATYKNFWRQTLRWMVRDVPDRVMVSTTADRAWIGEPLQIKTDVVDRSYVKVNDADVMATIYAPSGAVFKQKLEPSATGEDGEYHTVYTPADCAIVS